jgi:hypothetical protein
MRAAALALLAAWLLPGPVAATVFEVGPDLETKTLSAVIGKLQPGDTVRLAPGEYLDCAVIATKDVTIEGAGPDRTVLSDTTCGGKAILVISGANVTVRDLALTRARVADGNGAGIRDESLHLTVERVRFENNQNGILSGLPDGTGTLLVRDSQFLRNGSCERGCAHGIYAGVLQLLRVERSRFFETKVAHSIKSRALRTEVLDSEIADGRDGTSSFAIDIPNGGDVLIRGNTIQKGPRSDSKKVAILLGGEGVKNPTREIVIENNRFTNEADFDTAFVWNRTDTQARLTGNSMTGRGQELRTGPEPPKKRGPLDWLLR